MDKVKEFLENNGFERDEHEPSIYRGKKCNVRIFHSYFTIASRDWPDTKDLGFLHSKDLNIFWLVGALTWHGLIDKDYKGGL